MARVQPGRHNPTQQLDPQTVYNAPQAPSGHVPYGLSMLAPISTLSLEQEASLSQSNLPSFLLL